MQLLLLGSITAAVVLLGMVLLVPWLERFSWEREFTCPMPMPEASLKLQAKRLF